MGETAAGPSRRKHGLWGGRAREIGQTAGLTGGVRSADIVLTWVSVETGSSLLTDTNSEADPALHLQVKA